MCKDVNRNLGCLVLLFVMFFGMSKQVKADNFIWGVCGHPGSGPYDVSRSLSLAQQFQLMKEMGMGWYRADVVCLDPNAGDPSADQLDTLVPAAETAGIRLYPCLNPPSALPPYSTLLSRGWTLSQIYTLCYNQAYAAATKWAGDIEVWDLANEFDGWTLAGEYNGDLKAHYDTTLIGIAAAILSGQADGIHAGDPNAKVSLNTGGWIHYGFVDHMIDHATYPVDFDILAWHWYKSMGRIDKIASLSDYNLLNKLLSYGRPVWIGEGNAESLTGTYDPADTAWLLEEMRIMFEYRHSGAAAFFVYELLDEVDQSGIQAHFGMVEIEKIGGYDYVLKSRKPVFYSIQDVLADKVQSDGVIFTETFDGNSFDPNSWTTYTEGADPNLSVSGGQAHFETAVAEDASILSVPEINYGEGTEWAVKIKFRVNTFAPVLSTGLPTGSAGDAMRQVQLLTGKDGAYVADFAVTLLQHPSDANLFVLGWGTWFGNDAVVFATCTENLERDQWYTLQLHMRNDGEIDFYLDDVLIATKTAFSGTANALQIGDVSSNTGVKMDIDYVRCGLIVKNSVFTEDFDDAYVEDWDPAGGGSWVFDGTTDKVIEHTTTTEGRLSHDLAVTVDTNFTALFDYGWHYGNGDSQQCGIALLDDTGDGYGFFIREGQPNNKYEMYELNDYSFTSLGSVGGGPYEEGTCLAFAGFTWDSETGTLTGYREGVQKIQIADATYDTFTKVLLWDKAEPAAERGRFDNVFVGRYVPEKAFYDDFDDSNVGDWTATGAGSWSFNGTFDRILQDTNVVSSSNPAFLRHSLDGTAAQDWQLDFDYGWFYGDGASQQVGVSVLDDDGNGYGFFIRAADVAYKYEVFEITDHNNFASLGTAGGGPGETGWCLASASFSWDASSGTLTGYREGVQKIQVTDTTYDTFTSIEIQDRSEPSAERGMFDDIVLYTVLLPGQASSPSPSNSATGVSVTADLSWTAGGSTTSHNVYFGTDSTPDETEYIGNQAGTTYDPGTLAYGTTYYWRIDEVGPGGTTTGVVWSFTTTTTPPTFVAAGAVTSNTTAITPALPAGIATGDILLLFLETSNQAISISNQNGGTWTQVTNSPQYCGTAAGTTGARLTVFWSRYNGTQGAPTTSDSGDHQLGRMIAIRGAISTGNPWDVTAGGVEAVSDTSGSIPGATTTVANTLVVTAIATSLPDASSTAKFSAWTNANLTSVTERTDNSVTAGNGGGLGVATGIRAATGAYGNTAVTLVNAAYKGMMSIAIKP